MLTSSDGCYDCQLHIVIYNPYVIIDQIISLTPNIDIVSHFRMITVTSTLKTSTPSLLTPSTTSLETSWTMIVMMATAMTGKVVIQPHQDGDWRLSTGQMSLMKIFSWTMDVFTSHLMLALVLRRDFTVISVDICLKCMKLYILTVTGPPTKYCCSEQL